MLDVSESPGERSDPKQSTRARRAAGALATNACEQQPISPDRSKRRLLLLRAGAVLLIAVVAWLADRALADRVQARAAAIAAACLILWLTEVVPLYVTTLLLWASAVLLLGPLDSERFSVEQVLSWPAKPVLALFFGGLSPVPGRSLRPPPTRPRGGAPQPRERLRTKPHSVLPATRLIILMAPTWIDSDVC
jgi:hypothetical protein